MESNNPQLVLAAQQLLDPKSQPVFSELEHLAQQLEQYAADTLCKSGNDTNTSSSEFTPASSAHNVLEKLQTTVKQISNQSRQYYANVSAFGRLIEKSTVVDLETTCALESLDHDILDRVIVNHFLREGRRDIAEKIIEESKLSNLRIGSLWDILHCIRDSLLQRNAEPALEWLQRNEESAGESGIALCFSIARVQYLRVLLRQGPIEAMRFAQQHLPRFFQTHAQEIQTLLSKLLLSPDDVALLDNSIDDEWQIIMDAFTKCFCCCNGLPSESPLDVSITAGRIALPQMIKAKQLEARQRAMRMVPDSPVVEIELGKRFQYHSTFVCPVSKNMSTNLQLLSCGHVISKAAMLKITMSGRGNGKTFKCPTCPCEQKASDCRAIYI